MQTISKVFLDYNIATVLCFGFLAVRHVGISAPSALQGRVLITGPPGRSLLSLLMRAPISLTGPHPHDLTAFQWPNTITLGIRTSEIW